MKLKDVLIYSTSFAPCRGRLHCRPVSSSDEALRQVDANIRLLVPLVGCSIDGRIPLLVKHHLPQMLAHRTYWLALAYEYLKDHEQLRSDR